MMSPVQDRIAMRLRAQRLGQGHRLLLIGQRLGMHQRQVEEVAQLRVHLLVESGGDGPARDL